MNSKIFVFVAIIGLAAALGVILLFGSSFVSHTSEEDITKEIPQAPQQIQPISVELADISIIEAGKRDATIEITFKLSNPNQNSILLKDKIVLKNTGNTPELWSALESNTAKWRVSGDIFYNQSSMTSGQENELHFEFVK